MRFINQINNVSQIEIDTQVGSFRKELKYISKQPKSYENRQKIVNIYSQLDNLQLVPEYVSIIMDKEKDFDRACEGFLINGIKYKRFVGTTNGVKKETIVFICEKNKQNNEVYNILHKKSNNGRDESVPLIPAKFEAYKSLMCSSSMPVSSPSGIVVVKDCITEFKDDFINLDDSDTREPVMEIVKNQLVSLNASDGFGLILPKLAEKWSKEIKEDYIFSGCCIRNSFCKGMLVVFDFIDFANQKCDNYEIIDVWGEKHDIRNVEMVLTESMLKLWSSYKNLDDYLYNCKSNNYSFSITKITPPKLDNYRNLNYQFLQSYEFTDEEIYQLVLPTINEIKSALGSDVNKSILFLKGNSVNEDNVENIECDFVKALMVDSRMINDPYVRGKIYYMMKKRIDEAKIGVLKTEGNFSIISGDPYALCQSMFGLPVTGLLKRNECYSEFWSSKKQKEVVCFRAPMSCHNNIRILKTNNNDETKYWFRYIHTIFIINAWDMTCIAENGCDFDGDLFFTTNNPVLLKNTKQTLPIQCVQRTAEKKQITEEDLIRANKDSFGDEIGGTTNKITTMFDIMAQFPKDSLEYKTLAYRIKCGQLYQQNAIDKTKGIKANSMPLEWYSSSANKIAPEDDESVKKQKLFNLSILADKKPYFMNYVYPNDMKKYKNYIKNSSEKCIIQFGLTIEELKCKIDKAREEKEFLHYFNVLMPNSINDCTMNKICWLIEAEFENYINNSKLYYPEFDYSILKSKVEYDKRTYNQIFKLYKEYVNKLRDYLQQATQLRLDQQEATVHKSVLKQEFQKKALALCSNQYELCNIVIDICYSSNKSKQFAWDICGDVITENLLKANDYKIKYLEQNDNGDIEFCGEYFSKKIKDINTESEVFNVNNLK